MIKVVLGVLLFINAASVPAQTNSHDHAIASHNSLLALKVEPSNFKVRVGQPVRVTLILANGSAQDIVRIGGNPSTDYKFSIRDVDTGRIVRFVKPLRVALSGGPFIIIQTHNYSEATVNLEKFMALDRPGKYAMKVSTVFKAIAASGEMWRYKTISVESNTVYFQILP